MYSINKNTGQINWQSEKVFSGLVAELVVADNILFARLGGNFYDPGSKQFKLDKPLGVMGLDKVSGNRLWEFKGAKKGITNLVFLPDLHTVMLADGSNLIGIDSTSTGKVKESFKVPLEFVRSIGATDVASSAMKFGMGGITGMIKAGVQLASKKDRRDIPVSVMKLNNGNLVIRGRQDQLGSNLRFRFLG